MPTRFRVVSSFSLSARGGVLVGDIIEGEVAAGMQLAGKAGEVLTVSSVEFVDRVSERIAHVGLLFRERPSAERLSQLFEVGEAVELTEGTSRKAGDLTRYWFPLSSGLGIGVTASTDDEAYALATATRERLFPGAELRTPIVDVDVRELDSGHVLPNMGPCALRGVWFPSLNV